MFPLFLLFLYNEKLKLRQDTPAWNSILVWPEIVARLAGHYVFQWPGIMTLADRVLRHCREQLSKSGKGRVIK